MTVSPEECLQIFLQASRGGWMDYKLKHLRIETLWQSECREDVTDYLIDIGLLYRRHDSLVFYTQAGIDYYTLSKV